MKVHREFAQGSVQWIEAHCGIPTASEFDNLVTTKWEPRTGEMPKSYLARKLAEAWSGPLPGFGSWGMEQGQILEGEARPWLDFEFGWKIETVGFVTTDDGRIGCSPDGLIGEDGGVEIKCPEGPTHIKYLLNGILPPEYAAQVHGCMLVTGRPWWQFVSYRRHMPPLLIRVNRDEAIQEALREALVEFLERFDNAMGRLIEMNGGPPPKRIPMVFSDEIQRGSRYFGDEIIP
jgi:hypothetical protein